MFFFLLLDLQKVSEKVGGAEGTKLDEEFTEMEKARLNPIIPTVTMKSFIRSLSCSCHVFSPYTHHTNHFCCQTTKVPQYQSHSESHFLKHSNIF